MTGMLLRTTKNLEWVSVVNTTMVMTIRMSMISLMKIGETIFLKTLLIMLVLNMLTKTGKSGMKRLMMKTKMKLQVMKSKWVDAYMDTAERFAQLSSAERLKVGACVVKDHRIISIGYNGMPSGWDNICEEDDGKTKEEVIH